MPTIGMPQIIIEFRSRGLTAIQRSERGIVAVVLQDSTKTDAVTAYNRLTDIATGDWTPASYDYLRMVFLGGPYRVLAIRAVMDGAAINWLETTKILDTQTYNYLCAPDTTSSDQTAAASYVKSSRDNDKRTCKMVTANHASDHEGIINFTAANIGAKWSADEPVKTYTTIQYTARIAGILAGLPLSRSATYYDLSEIVSVDLVTDMDAAVNAGQIFIFNDGKGFKLSRAVNSLTTYTADKGQDFSFIKIVEALDMIRDDITTTFRDFYVGKIVNDYDNKQQFVAVVNSYLTLLEGNVLDRSATNAVEISLTGQRQYLQGKGIDVDAMSDIEILRANTSTFVYLAGRIKPVNAMEDLNLQLDI